MASPLHRAIILVIDSGGVGEMPDAADYGDEGSDTLGHVARAAGGLKLPAFARLGLANLHPMQGTDPLDKPEGFYGKMCERSAGKDTTTGHWEMAGLVTNTAAPTYPDGFPPEIIEPFEKAIGKKILGNKAASGTEIITELGEEHVRSGRPIVYTSADSVFQIACHEDVYPIEELYRICQVARDQLRPPHDISRVIARPFLGTAGQFTRTHRRKDFSVVPHGETCLDRIVASGRRVVGIGKIKDIFAGQGISASHSMKDNLEGLEITRRVVQNENESGVIFTNLVDFDMLYGHRNDATGYAKALKDMDDYLPRLLDVMKDGDALFITADHGCDPTILTHTDHTREFVPILAWGRGLGAGGPLGTRNSFGDLSATVLAGFGLNTAGLVGESFAPQLWKELAAC